MQLDIGQYARHQRYTVPPQRFDYGVKSILLDEFAVCRRFSMPPRLIHVRLLGESVRSAKGRTIG
eukprot:6195726-Pleurochrysis_carterae.AAC.2